MSLGADGKFLEGIEEERKGERLAKSQTRRQSLERSKMLIALYCLHSLFVETNACAFYNLHETLGILAVNSAIRVTVPDLDLPTSPLWAYQWFLKTGGGGGRAAGMLGTRGKSHAPVVCREIPPPLRAAGIPASRDVGSLQCSMFLCLNKGWSYSTDRAT